MPLDTTTDNTLDDLIEFLDSLSNRWFLTSESCLEVLQTNEIWLKNHPLNVGIYCAQKEVQEILKKLPSPSIWMLKGLPAEATFFFFCKVKLLIFIDYYGYLAEIRFNDLINRYRVLIYDPNIITNGTKNIKSTSLTKKLNLLKSAKSYCEAMYGDGYLKIKQWNRWNDPKNIIWEDFIQKPKRLF